MPHAPRVLLVRNDAGSDGGSLPAWLAADNVTPARLLADEGAEVPTDATEYDGIVLLGGGLLPDDLDHGPWLAAEAELTRSAVAHGVPLLGICLGGQLLAHATGGRVRGRYGRPERGITSLTVLPAAAGDPLFGSLPSTVPAVESHRDQITELPPDAALLMSSEDCPVQALRVGDRAWGVQFHPECAGTTVLRWDADRLRGDGFDPDAVYATARARDAEVTGTWRGVVRRFANLVRPPTD